MKLALLRIKNSPTDLFSSTLLNEETFYPVFIKDLKRCKSEVIIESPFITHRRLAELMPVLKNLKDKKVRVVISTRDPHECNEECRRDEAHHEIATLQRNGIHVLYTEGHHRKLAIIDRSILYEGSLNILSQSKSIEVMRRVESVQLAWQMIRFAGIDKYF